MNAPDVRRLLEDLGSTEPPAPDAEFLDRLEFQLRAEAIAQAPDTYADAPWRLPFGIAAAAFSVVAGVAGITVVRDLPNREVSAQLASVSGAVVIYPDGQSRRAYEGMTIPEGAVVRVTGGGSAEVNGLKLTGDQAVKVTDKGIVSVAPEDAATAESRASGRSDGGSSGEDEVGLSLGMPDSDEGSGGAASPTTGSATSAPKPTSSAPSTTISTSHDVSGPRKDGPASVIGLADDTPGPAPEQTTPQSTRSDTAARSTTTEARRTTTTAAPPQTTATTPPTPAPTTPSTVPQTTVPTPGGPAVVPAPVPQPPPVADGAASPVTTTTVTGPPGGTTTTTVPVQPDGEPADPGVGPDGEPVDPGVTPDGDDGEVFPASAGDGEPVAEGAGDTVSAASEDDGEPFGTDDETAADDTSSSGTSDGDPAGTS